MKSKMRFRLFLYFAASLLVFSIIVGIVFTILFSRHNLEVNKENLEDRAIKISQRLSDFYDGTSSKGMMKKGMGYGAYIRFIEDIAMSDVWIVDPNYEQIIRGNGQLEIAYKDLPSGAEEVISKALSGKTTLSESFSSLLDSPSITVATPIVLSSGEVIGAVLLHSQLGNISSGTLNGLFILFLSMIVAVIISFVLAGVLASRFTRSLSKMKEAALKISGGNFLIKTGINQNDEIGELATAMDSMAMKLDIASKESKKLDELRRDFVANISHELRTPVTVLRGSLEALCDGIVSEANMVSEYHKQMLDESLHLERLVEDLLDISRLQNPDFKMNMESVDLKGLIDDVVRSMKRVAVQKNIDIFSNYENGEFEVRGDYGRLRQMLMIVLDNGIKFSEKESNININLERKDKLGLLTIVDKGCGIEEKDLPYIFDRFYKQRSEHNKQGTGLGLAIAKQIADRHDIDMNIESELNNGTKVIFKFQIIE